MHSTDLPAFFQTDCSPNAAYILLCTAGMPLMRDVTQQERQQLLLELASSRDASSAAAAVEALLPCSTLDDDCSDDVDSINSHERWNYISRLLDVRYEYITEMIEPLLVADQKLRAQLITPLMLVLQQQHQKHQHQQQQHRWQADPQHEQQQQQQQQHHQQHHHHHNQQQQQQQDEEVQQQLQQQHQPLGAVEYPECGKLTAAQDAAVDLLQHIASMACRSDQADVVRRMQQQLQLHVDWLLRAACSNSQLADAAAYAAGCVARPAAMSASIAYSGWASDQVQPQSLQQQQQQQQQQLPLQPVLQALLQPGTDASCKAGYFVRGLCCLFDEAGPVAIGPGYHANHQLFQQVAEQLPELMQAAAQCFETAHAVFGSIDVWLHRCLAP
jgi:hypothetical protein